jgi:hypothetical protein
MKCQTLKLDFSIKKKKARIFTDKKYNVGSHISELKL